MDRFHHMQVYVAVAEEGGFAAAARRLKISPPAVTRAVAGLEENLGVKLLNRSTRSVRMTEAGRRYLEDSRQILTAVESAQDAAVGVNAEPRGHLAVTAPAMFGRKFVTLGIVDYLQRHPAMEVDAVFLDRVVNLVEEGFDVGIRIGELPDSSLQALQIAEVRSLVVASPNYLQSIGRPLVPQDLREHTIVASSAGNFNHSWRFGKQSGEHAIRIKPRLSTSTNDAAIEACTAGFGITRLLSYQVADEIQSGKLEALLTEYEPPALPVHIVHREGRYGSAKVRAFIDLMADRVRKESALLRYPKS